MMFSALSPENPTTSTPLAINNTKSSPIVPPASNIDIDKKSISNFIEHYEKHETKFGKTNGVFPESLMDNQKKDYDNAYNVFTDGGHYIFLITNHSVDDVVTEKEYFAYLHSIGKL